MSIEKTPNYNLNKPGYENFGDIADLNENADIIDTALQNKVDKVSGKGLSEADFTTLEKSKLAGISEGAQPNAVTSVGGKTGAVTLSELNLDKVNNTADADKNVLTATKLKTPRNIQGKPFDGSADISFDNASDTVAGLMSAADKLKLNGLANYDDTAVRGLITDHTGAEVGSSGGVHGLRWYEDKLQFFNGTDWIEIETGGGGLPPSNVLNPSIEIGNTKLTIRWTDPEDTVIDGSTVSTWAGTKLVRKAGSFPENPNDGVVLVDNKVRGAYTLNGYADSGLTNGTTYYYQLFPYNDVNGVNKNPVNRLSGAPQPFVTFGVSIDLANNNPETAVTYTDGAVGMTPGSAWNTMAIFKDIKPCMLKNGVVQYYLNPNDLTKKADGTSADITSGNDGDVMIEIPKTGFKISTSGNTLTIKITDNPTDTTNFKYYAHTRSSEGDRSKLYIGAYLGWKDGNSKLRSLSGKTPTASQNIGTFRTQAKANGSGYDQVSFYPLTLLQCLYMIKYKNRNSQVAIGRGYVDGNSSAINTGGTNNKGIDFGEGTGKQQMCFLNIEDMWGNLRWWIDGFWSDSSRNMWTAFTNFNDNGSGASYTNRGQGATSDIGNYMSKPQGTTEAGFVAKEVSGSETTHFTDYADLSASRLPDFGGDWSNGSYAGVFSLSVSLAADSSHSSLGARLMYL